MTLLLRRKYEARLRHAERVAAHSHASGGDGAPEYTSYTSVLRLALATERRVLLELRARGVIGDDAFHRVEEELDWAELNTETMARRE